MDAFEAEDADYNNLLNKAKSRLEGVKTSQVPNYDKHKLELKSANGEIEDATKCVSMSTPSHLTLHLFHQHT